MAKKDKETIEWFGADVEEHPERGRTELYLPGKHWVDAAVPRPVRQADGTYQTQPVRMPAPRHMMVKTTSKRDHKIGQLTARYKMARDAFHYAPVDDKETWERRMHIAHAEMQIARFQQKLANYQAREANPRPEQVQLLKEHIWKWQGRFAELTGQG